jgi:ADP-dependent NAD(P)H-hydrate dehydratase / NAD(P)H-hydrate epimerase
MRLPDWLEPLLDSSEQRALDRWAIEELGIPSLELMERAGTGLAELVARHFPDGRIVVVCGKGNNGGDGLVAARVLRAAGRDVDVASVPPLEELGGDARANLERLRGPPPLPFDPVVLDGAAVIVDAILGTGSSGEPREPAKSAIEALLGGAPVIACDVPSGVDASTGEVPGTAVRAVATVTFHAGKPGLWIQPGKSHAGEVERVEIGIPAGGPVSPELGLIDELVLDRVPRRGADSTKFAAGSVLICGGSTGLTGAPCLASESAMRAGAGYVTAAVPSSLNGIFESRLLEVMTLPLPDEHGSLVAAGVESVLERVPRLDSLVLGPGLGRAGQAMELARELARRAELPLLLDADGLNAHAEALELLAARAAATVLTPHAGELGRLLGVPSAAIAQRRLHSVRRAAAAANAVVVLKGDDTLVADPSGRVGVSRGGSPALATAGTGDVLSGVIGAFLAKRMEPFAAACAGVFAHAVAGQDVAREVGVEGAIAGDVITRLPRARRRDGAGSASDRLG